MKIFFILLLRFMGSFEEIIPAKHMEHFLACEKGFINVSYRYAMFR